MEELKSQVMTAEDLAQLPDRGKRYELRMRELLMMTPAGALLGRITMILAATLHQYAAQHQLGQVFAAETGFQIHSDPDTVRAPDIAFVARDRIPPEGVPRGFWELAPDLVVKVVSPNDRAADVQDKIEEWLDAGVRQVWVIYPDTEMVWVCHSPKEVDVLKPGDTLVGDDLLPGFRCSVEDLFAL